MDVDLVRDHEPTLQESPDQGKDIVVLEGNIVDFDGPGDRQDPLNWPPAYKWSMVTLISLLSLVV